MSGGESWRPQMAETNEMRYIKLLQIHTVKTKLFRFGDIFEQRYGLKKKKHKKQVKTYQHIFIFLSKQPNIVTYQIED